MASTYKYNSNHSWKNSDHFAGLRNLPKTPLTTLNVPSLPEGTDEELLQDCQYIGSYNWIPGANKNNKGIIVPGSPNIWIDPRMPMSVYPDKGEHYRDQNNHILPGKPLIPLIAAVHKQGIFPDEDWKNVDFITDRNGLRKLLRWVTGAKDRDFRIDTQLIGRKTVVLNRWEMNSLERMSGNTFGFNFEKASTKPAPGLGERSEGHHRIVTYKFGTLRIVVQFEVDACVAPEQSEPSTASTTEGTDEDLAEVLAKLELSNTNSTVFGLKVESKGNPNIPHSAIVEMCTKATTSRSNLDWRDRYPQLYFSQTNHHFTARHLNGVFSAIDKTTLDSDELLAVKARMQPALGRLEVALHEIQSLVIQHGRDQRLSLVYQHKDKYLAAHELSGGSCLPAEALALFD